MRTPRRPRLTRRQSEHLLDGTGGPADLARLLADARPVRASGELPGESEAVAAFRSGVVTPHQSDPWSPAVRTIPFRRGVLTKALVVSLGCVALGGVAVAATGHLPGAAQRVSPTAGIASKTGAPATPTAGSGAHAGVGVHGTGAPAVRPTGLPGLPGPGGPGDPRHGVDDHAVWLCRAVTEAGRRAPVVLTKSQAFQDMQVRAGGPDKVAPYCAKLVWQWCGAHKWPASHPMAFEGRSVVIRCVRPTTPPSRVPGGAPTAGPTGSVTGVPVHPTSPAGRVAPPSGGPATN